jgi:hypothetical protein
VSTYTITYSRTVPKGEGKFGSFEKMEITRQFETAIPTTVGAAMCKAFVLNQLGMHAEADTQLQQVFIEQRNVVEDVTLEISQPRPVGIIAPVEDRQSQLRVYLIDLGFDIDDVRSAEAAAARAKGL